MTEKMRESLSALMDDEANELELQRVLSQIGDSEELRQTWVRYNATRAAIGGQSVAHLNIDISHRVSAALKGDSSAAERDKQGLSERLLRPLAGFAVAASVAATVVFGGQQLAQLGAAGGQPAISIAASGPSPVGLVNIQGATPVYASHGVQSVPVLEPAAHQAYQRLANQRMQMYLQEHAEHAALNSPHGLIPFARVSKIRE